MEPISLICAEAGQGRGGSGYSLRRLLVAARELAGDGLRVAVAGAAQTDLGLFAEAGLPTFNLPAGPAGRWELRRWLQAARADVFHCNNAPYEHLANICAARSAGAAVTVHFRCSRPLTRLERLGLRLVARGFAVSESGAAVLRGSCLGAARSECLSDGVQLEEYRLSPAERAAARAEFGVAEEALLLLLPATLQPGKGQDLAIEAALRLRGRSRPPVWLLAGAEHYQFPGFAGELAEALAAKGLGNSVLLLGHRADLPRLLAAADAVILPSRLTEGTPCAILEAFAAGRPVAASRVGGIPELVDDSVGRLLEPGSAADLAAAAVELDENRELTARLGAAAARRAEERYDIRRIAGRWLAALEPLAGRRRRA